MLNVEEALKLVEEHAARLAPRRVPLREAMGLVLAEEVTSDINSPPYDKALMDGYAVRSADREPERQILEEIAAGAVPHLPLTPGTASRIMTGAPIPEGADAVVQVEHTELVDDYTVRLHNVEIMPGRNVLKMGASLRAGETILRRGTRLRAIEIAVLAEIGHAMVTVVPRPRLAILPTGNELVSVGERPASGQIRNSNGPMLLAAAGRAEVDAIELGIARDNREELARWIEQGLSADVLVLSGGVSAGKFDLVPKVLTELGVTLVFHQVALRPGKPLWFGVKTDGQRRVLVFALPGNPVSSLVCFELFVRPAIAALAGRGFVQLSTIQAKLSHTYEHKGGRAACLPARLTTATQGPAGTGADQLSSPLVEILPWQGSADMATLTRANALACLPVDTRRFEPGSELSVVML
ncbi:MAG TPA: gephyrin-like molybdotransferase Glp [Lacipirellulaceae bacterium]|nr:gephyrin-like molybdotransferase Glp [Lacipirellulaceae bacterium]